MVEQALSDVRVLDVTRYIAGPACTKMLADYGADVIKVERPGVGDGARNMGPFYRNEPHPEKSGLFLYLNMNKRGITLDLKSKMGKQIFIGLVKRSQVVVENFRPGVMDRLGLGYKELEKVNPSLVMTSISNFGQTGPYRDYKLSELMAFGMGGAMNVVGLPNREPLKYGGTVSIYHAGVVASMATMIGIYGSRYQGVGQHLDVSIMETQAGSIDRRIGGLVTYQYTGKSTSRGATLGTQYPSGTYPCSDGYFRITGGGPRFPRVVEMMANPPELSDTKWYTPEAQGSPELKEEFEAIFLGFTMQHTKAELFEMGQKAKIICAPAYSIDEVFEDPHFNVHGFFEEVDHPVTGKLKYPARPFVMSETPFVARRPAPLLGQHNDEVFTELGYSKTAIAMMREVGAL